MGRQIIIPAGFEVWEHGKLVAVAVRDIHAGEPWRADMFANYAGAPGLPDAIVRLRTFTISATLPMEKHQCAS